MSLVKTLAKVAVGVAIAKGVSTVMQSGATRGGKTASGGMFGGQYSPGGSSKPQTGLEDMMGSILGGKTSGSTGSSGGLGGLLESVGGAKGGSGSGIDGILGQLSGGRSGGLGDMLGGLEKALGGSGGGLGGLLGGLAGAAGGAAPTNRSKPFGEVLNSAFERQAEPEVPPTPEQDAVAGLLLKAMIQAAKADGEIDADEKQKIFDKLGDVTREEAEFVRAAVAAPVDIEGLVRMTPKGLERQVYLMSVMGIDLDNQQEAQYLHALASAYGIDKAEVNAIHAQLGVPQLYA